MLTFPTNAELDEIYPPLDQPAVEGRRWKWDGVVWAAYSGVAGSGGGDGGGAAVPENVFYLAGGVTSLDTDLDLYPSQDVGAYYIVLDSGTYTSGENSFSAQAGDGFLKTPTGWQKFDNGSANGSANVNLFGTANEIAVTGDGTAGYTVAVADEFKTRVSDVEAKTQNIVLDETTADFTKIGGHLSIQQSTATGTNPEFSVGHDSTTPYFKTDINGVSIYGGLTVALSGPLLTVGLDNSITFGDYWSQDVRIGAPKLAGIAHPFLETPPSIENFIIDGSNNQLKIKQGFEPPSLLQPSELYVDQTSKGLYVGDSNGVPYLHSHDELYSLDKSQQLELTNAGNLVFSGAATTTLAPAKSGSIVVGSTSDSTPVHAVRCMTQGEYDALGTYDPNTLYFIK